MASVQEAAAWRLLHAMEFMTEIALCAAGEKYAAEAAALSATLEGAAGLASIVSQTAPAIMIHAELKDKVLLAVEDM